MKLYRILAIFEKDMKEFMRNMSLFTMILLPIVMSLLFSNINVGDQENGLPLQIVLIIVGVTYSAIAYNSMATMIAEENEKDTLRGLVQSPATLLDIILGKSLVAFLMSSLSLVISLAIAGALSVFSFTTVIAALLLLMFFLGLGIAVGLIVKSVATTAVYTMPIMFIFGMSQYIEFIITDPNHLSRKIFNYLPIYQLYFIAKGENILQSFIILLVWLVLVLIVVFYAFKKQSKDDNN